jgi:hypothetical protein
LSSWIGAEVAAAILDDIRITVFAPKLKENDDRPVAIVRGMERAFPGMRLGWTVTDDHQMLHLPERDAWLAQAMRDGDFPLLCNNDETYPVMIAGSEYPAAFQPGGQAQLKVRGHLPPDAAGVAAAADVLEAVSEAAHAFWGDATPYSVRGDIVRQTKNGPSDLEPPPRGLPWLKLPREMPSPAIPQCLGWLCYWSVASARIIGFPDPARDAELLSRSRRTASGGWVVQLTDEPLDLDRPAHLDALKRAYERFPEIGGRSAL